MSAYWVPGSPLRSADYAALAKCGILANIADQALLRRVDSLTGAEMFGCKGGGNYEGIVFPYPDIEDPDKIVEFALRLDHPPLERSRDGTLKEVRKYIWPPGRGNRLYIARPIKREWLFNPDIPFIVVEGLKKALALWSLAWHGLDSAAEHPRWIPTALSGVWNFRGTVGKAETADGSRTDIKGVIADFERVPWGGREVRILFDTNVRTNDNVQAARYSLAKVLREDYGGRVLFIDMPADCGVNGVDDLIGVWGPDRVLELIESAYDPQAKKKRPAGEVASQATKLLKMCGGVECFRTPDQTLFATFPINGHMETHRMRSKAFQAYLRDLFVKTTGGTIGSSGLSDAIGVLQARALWESGPPVMVYSRVGQCGSNIYIDLGNDQWNCVEVTPQGWHIKANSPVKFQRTAGMKSLPEPYYSEDAVPNFWSLVNVKDEKHRALVKAWLVAALRPVGPYPVLILNGPQGSAKTSASRVIRILLDDNIAPIRAQPKEERDLAIAASNSRVIALDNLSHLPDWLSDAICRVSTGGGFSTRELYSDNEEALFYVQRPVILNGIEEIVTRGDLLDRSLLIELPPIEGNRMAESEFLEKFENFRPSILGHFLDLVSTALRNVGSLKLPNLPRMADFAKWAAAAFDDGRECQVVIGKAAKGDEIIEVFTERRLFLAAYNENRTDANTLTLEASTVAGHLIEFLRTKRFLEDGKEYWQWSGSCADLLEFLEARATDSERKAKRWPKNARALSNALRRLLPNLKQSGIDVEFERDRNGRTITLSSYTLKPSAKGASA